LGATFNIIGAMAEFERALIQERVKAGIRNARAKGKKLGRPRKCVDTDSILHLRSQGHSLRQIASKLRVSVGLIHANLKQRP
jgi:DNA invertase Pin-like site-specific DNA recombinase